MKLNLHLGKLLNIRVATGKDSGSRIGQIMEGDTSWMGFLGAGTPENYTEYMEQYAEEVYIYGCIYLIANTIAGFKTGPFPG